MSQSFFTMFVVLLGIMQGVITFFAFVSKNERKRIIKWGFLTAFLVSIFQIGAYQAKTYFVVSMLQSLAYAFSVMYIIICFWFTVLVVNQTKNKTLYGTFWAARILGTLDIIMIMVNPFKEFMISYEYNPDSLTNWKQIFYPPYFIHKGCQHLLILFIVITILLMCKNMPKLYASPYIRMAMCIFIFSVIGFIIKASTYGEELDVSIINNAFITFALYWIVFHHMDGAMVDHVRAMALNEYSSPMILFDYQNELIMVNDETRKMYDRLWNDGRSRRLEYRKYNVNSLIEDFAIESDGEELLEDRYYNISVDDEGIIISYRMHYTVLFDFAGKVNGKLFVFDDVTEEMDDLTGFHKQDAFYKYFDGNYAKLTYPVSVILFDIKKLEEINEVYGAERGDRCIQYVAMSLKKWCPDGTYFVRGKEANLYAVCSDTDEKKAKEITRNISEAVNQKEYENGDLDVRTLTGIVKSDIQSITKVAETITVNMRTKKLVDFDAEHTTILDSLIQMQKESDPYLENHIKRTRNLCNLFAEKLELTDYQKNNLALLCLIHDIGNIGVPMEIVNKPGRLTKDEWEIMKSHVNKGYRICCASDELKDVAVCVLHHHEWYNGKGYPDGLAGDSIPLLSRIIAIVETYDAMTNERPYRPPLTSAEARNELVKCSGEQYDPEITKLFIELLNEIAPIDVEEERRIKKSRSIAEKPMSLNDSSDEDAGFVDEIKHSTYILDDKNQIIEIDESFETITGYSRSDIERLGMNQIDLIFPLDREDYLNRVKMLIEKTGEAYLEHRIKCKDNSEKYVFCYGRRYYDNVAKAGRSTIIITDISESKRNIVYSGVSEPVVEEQKKLVIRDNGSGDIKWIESTGETDNLTGLMSRKVFEGLNEQLCENKEDNLLLVLIDIDDYGKHINNSGEKNSESIVRFFGNSIKQVVNNQGIASRIGEDTFACMISISGDISEMALKSKISEIWGQIMDAAVTDNQNVTISIGASFSAANDTADKRNYKAIFDKARVALLEVKQDGKNGYIFKL